MEIQIEEIRKVKEQFDKDESECTTSDLKNKYLGKKGLVKELMTSISSRPGETRKEFGREANILKTYIEERISLRTEKVESDLNTPKIDVSAPFDINTEITKRPQVNKRKGSIHPISSEMKRILEIFQRMGFDIVESRQLDDDYHMFESLNIPKGHPARDIWDTFWTDENLIPPAHTSTMQNRVMRSYKLPIRVVIPGRCFRNEATDASHEHTFYQIEGVYVDKGISLGNMIGTIQTYLESFFESSLEVKIQPGYFPFTEPSCEFVISCPFCKKTGCNVCGYSGWMEVMGCGIIHPKVLQEAGIDPKEYSGFAWGFGLDRLVMLKNSIQDIRRFHGGDINFLSQFE